MPKYLFEASYSPEGVAGVADKGGSARRDAIGALFESVGGKLEGLYFAFGDNDVYAFGELPDNEAATVAALTVNRTGLATVRTVPLLSADEVDRAAQRTADYTPPGG
jgi:uncharacterized protein with GYD domain